MVADSAVGVRLDLKGQLQNILLLNRHPCHRFQRAVASSCEVVFVSLHLNGFQPVSHRAKSGEVWCALIQQGTDGSVHGSEREIANVTQAEKRQISTAKQEPKYND